MVTRAAIALVLLAGCQSTSASSERATRFIRCASAADCPRDLPMCASDSQVCVGCLADMQTCGPGRTCDEASHRCVPADPRAPCVRNADCPRPGVDDVYAVVCLVDAGACVGCLDQRDCVVPDVCQVPERRCGPPRDAGADGP